MINMKFNIQDNYCNCPYMPIGILEIMILKLWTFLMAQQDLPATTHVYQLRYIIKMKIIYINY